MPKIFSRRMVKDGFEYEIALDFKDAAIAEDRLEIDIVGRRRRERKSPLWLGRKSNWEETTITLRGDLAEGRIVMLHGDKVLGSIEIRGDMAEDAELSAIEEIFEPTDEFAGQSIEQILQAIPADPVIGCILKSGTSAVVGQTIRCANRTKDMESLRRRVRATFACLGDHATGILGTAARRTIICMFTLGLF